MASRLKMWIVRGKKYDKGISLREHPLNYPYSGMTHFGIPLRSTRQRLAWQGQTKYSVDSSYAVFASSAFWGGPS